VVSHDDVVHDFVYVEDILIVVYHGLCSPIQEHILKKKLGQLYTPFPLTMHEH
jgi:hypothetical protein